jgi:zinc protease
LDGLQLSPILHSPTFQAHSLTLDSGLTLIHQQTPATSVSAVDVWVKAGAIVEPDPWSGMAHFLEHMIFKGTEQLPPGAFDWAIESCGGITNAATSHDYAHFFITSATQHLEATLPYLSELLLNAAIPDEEFGRERDVVLEEINQSFDNPDWIAFQSLGELVYPQHPYGRPILGTADLLLQLTPAEMRDFHRTYYQPENMTVVLVGDVTQSQAVDLISQAFQPFPSRSQCPRSIPTAAPSIDGIRRQELCLPRLEQARLMMAWVGPGLDAPDQPLDQQLQVAYGLDVLSVVLAEGRTSRLVRELREERNLVQAVSSGFSLQKESGLFTITAWLEPEHLERVEAIICDRLSELATAPISPAELDRCKRLLSNDYAFSTETPSQLAGLYGYYSMIAQAEVAATYPQRIQSLRAEDLQQLAQRYLSPYHYAATIVRPA